MPKHKIPKKRSSSKSDDDSSDIDDENTVIDPKEYKKFLNTLFPSKFLQDQINEEEQVSKKCKDKKCKDKKKTKKSNKITKSNKKDKKEEMVDIVFTILPKKNKKDGDDDIDEDYDEDEDYEDEDDSDYETEETEEEESEDSEEESEDSEEEDDEETDEDETEDEEDTEDEDEEDEDEDEEDEDEDEEDEEDEEEIISSKHKRDVRKSSGLEKKKDKTEKKKEDDIDIYEQFSHFMKQIKKTKQNKEAKSQLIQFEKQLNKKKEKMDKKKKGKNVGKYIKLISNKNLINDVKFFKESMNLKEQEEMIEELEKVKGLTHVDKPYRIQLLENKNIPDLFKAIALKKINAMKLIADGGGEYNKIKNWIDTFMRIPFNVISTLPVERGDSQEKIHEYMEQSQKILDDAVYGMKDAKVQFMQMVAQWVANPQSIGNSIAIKGPMGTGKTTLIKYGVSKLLNREFAFIPLGGATDSSYLEGHSYTYEGSTYGKIVDILLQCKSSNPVIYFDELDKVSDTPKGEEIIGILTHLTDTTQNDKFHDRYFSEIDFDLSKCLFIFSYNDESKINPILKDRMYNIETKGYEANEKVIISNDYLIPKLESELKMEKGSLVISEDMVKHIVEKYTKEEKGVRNLKRCLEIIYSKLNLYMMMKPGTQLFGDKIIEDIQFPFTINEEIIEKVLKTNSDKNVSHMAMYL